MRAIIQRVSGLTKISYVQPETSEHVELQFLGPGLVVLVGWTKEDEEPACTASQLHEKEEWIKSRVKGLRIFPDREGRMNLNLSDYMEDQKKEDGGILWVPQFTLAATLDSGFRPSFIKAMEPRLAKEQFKSLVGHLRIERNAYRQIYGAFGTDMDIHFTAWGPVTIPLEL